MTTKKVPGGLGLWIAFPAMLGGTWTKIAARCKALGARWVAVRTTDASLAGANLEGAVRAMHAQGIGFYGWHYSYPDADRVASQVKHMVRCQAAGADGHFINAEIEFTGKRLEAVRLGEAVRAVLPEWWIAHAPLGWIDYHPQWPYEEFIAFCDAVAPQLYWTELKAGAYSAEFKVQIQRWADGYRNGGKEVSWILKGNKLVIPIGVTYGKGDVATKQQPPGYFHEADLRAFLEADTDAAPAVSLYSLEVAHPTATQYLETTWGGAEPPDDVA